MPEHDLRLAKLHSPDFDPRQLAYIESSAEVPRECRGQAELSYEVPTKLKVHARLETAGLVVLTDLWDKGWRAYLDGQRVPILRTDHALRGVVAPAGSHLIEFRYQSASFRCGVCLAAGAMVALLLWTMIAWRSGKIISVNDNVMPKANVI